MHQAGVHLTDHAIDCAEEHRALCGGGRLAQILHNQRAVAKDIDKLAQMEETNLLKVLPLLISGGSTERQGETHYPDLLLHHEALHRPHAVDTMCELPWQPTHSTVEEVVCRVVLVALTVR